MNDIFYNTLPKNRKRRKTTFSKNTKNNVFEPSDHKKKYRNIKRFLELFISIISIVFILYFFFYSDFFKVNEIRVNDNGREEFDMKILNTLLSYKGKNIFFIDDQDIKNKLKSYISESAYYDIRKILPDTIKITILPYKDAINLIFKIDKVEKKYVINENGVISKENLNLADLPIVILMDATDTLNVAFKKQEISYMVSAKNYFEEKFNIMLTKMEYYQIEHELHLVTEKGFRVWLDIDQPYLTQIHALKIALSKLDIFSTPLLYIDLRVSNGQKIIFKEP
jgi:cell division septal protein FtsQ